MTSRTEQFPPRWDNKQATENHFKNVGWLVVIKSCFGAEHSQVSFSQQFSLQIKNCFPA